MEVREYVITKNEIIKDSSLIIVNTFLIQKC